MATQRSLWGAAAATAKKRPREEEGEGATEATEPSASSLTAGEQRAAEHEKHVSQPLAKRARHIIEDEDEDEGNESREGGEGGDKAKGRIEEDQSEVVGSVPSESSSSSSSSAETKKAPQDTPSAEHKDKTVKQEPSKTTRARRAMDDDDDFVVKKTGDTDEEDEEEEEDEDVGNSDDEDIEEDIGDSSSSSSSSSSASANRTGSSSSSSLAKKKKTAKGSKKAPTVSRKDGGVGSTAFAELYMSTPFTVDPLIASSSKSPSSFLPSFFLFDHKNSLITTLISLHSHMDKKRIPYLAVARTLEAIEATTKRLEIVSLFCNLLRSVICTNTSSLLHVIYLCTNQVLTSLHFHFHLSFILFFQETAF